MIIDYSVQKTFTQSLIIDDIGNFCIRCNSSAGYEYYMAVGTLMGKTEIIKFGPVIADLGEMETGFDLSYKKINFKEDSIQKEVNLYVNDGRKQIELIEIIDKDTFYSMIPPITLEA